jgi:hypothetical protein
MIMPMLPYAAAIRGGYEHTRLQSVFQTSRTSPESKVA